MRYKLQKIHSHIDETNQALGNRTDETNQPLGGHIDEKHDLLCSHFDTRFTWLMTTMVAVADGIIVAIKL